MYPLETSGDIIQFRSRDQSGGPEGSVFEGTLRAEKGFLQFKTHRRTGEGSIRAAFQQLTAAPDPMFILSTEQSNGVWNCSDFQIRAQKNFHRYRELNLSEVGLDSLFEQLYPPAVWKWNEPLRHKLLPITYSISNTSDGFFLEIKANTGNFGMASRNFNNNPRWYIYEEIFTSELSEAEQIESV